MPTNNKMRFIQNSILFDLLKLAKDNNGADNIKGLDELIVKTQAAMSAEEVAYVEKMIAKLK